jgi:molybdenum cofactor biosynthesis enzyme MoaA
MKLEDIGFYTLCDKRAEGLSTCSPMWRCEMILTDRCNFACPYCRGLREDCQGTMPIGRATRILDCWLADDLRNIRFSGGEPMLYPELEHLVLRARRGGCERVAISTNGSFPLERYLNLIECGVNDFSISLDACCAASCGKMAGVDDVASFTRITSNIRELSKLTYVTVGVVLTDDNLGELVNIIEFAARLGVSDIRIIPAAQEGNMIKGVERIEQKWLDKFPILRYRVFNILDWRPVRSIQEHDSHRCYLPIDDSVVAGDYHFPCVIYMREQGDPIGQVGPNMRSQRAAWSETHNTFEDPICRKNCLDVCVDHNNKCACHWR